MIITREEIQAWEREKQVEAHALDATLEMSRRAEIAEEEARIRGFQTGREECQAEVKAAMDRLAKEIEAVVSSMEEEIHKGTLAALKSILGTLPPELSIALAVRKAIEDIGLNQGLKLLVHPSLREHIQAQCAELADGLQIADDAFLHMSDAVLETPVGRFHVGPLHYVLAAERSSEQGGPLSRPELAAATLEQVR